MKYNNQYTINFHETFSLSRVSLSKILKASEESKKINKDILEKTTLGTNYQKAMPRYAYRAGLLDNQRCLTLFGNYVTTYDPLMENISTQWLLHYYLAAPHQPTAFWNYLINKRFLIGNTFSRNDLINDLKEFLSKNTGKIPSLGSINATVTIFLGTYLKSDGLNRIGIIEEVSRDTYTIPDVNSPPVWVIGYSLAEYWHAHYQESLTVNLEYFIDENFTRLFLLGEKGLMDILTELKHKGVIDLYRIAYPYQIVLLQPELEFYLKKIYE